MKLWFEKGAWASEKGKKVASGMTPESVQSIVIIRHAAIGDMMVLRPFLVQARTFFPNAKITISIINTYNYGVPEDLVDRIHVVDKKKEGKKTSFLSRLKQIKELGEHDLLFDMADTSLSQIICLLTPVILKIGFPYRSLKKYFYDISILRSDLVPEVDTLLHMIHILGSPKLSSLDYGYICSHQKDDKIIYFMSASVPSKQWPEINFIALIKKMSEAYPAYEHIVLEGIGPNEKVANTMNQLKSFSNVSKVDSRPIEEIISFLSSSKMVICNDTGIRNMAIAAETKTVGIFFSTVPYRYLPNNHQHIGIFEPDGSIPSVEKVFEGITTLME